MLGCLVVCFFSAGVGVRYCGTSKGAIMSLSFSLLCT